MVDHGYTYVKAAEAVNVSHSAITRWVNKLRLERQGKTPARLPLTPEQLELREARKKIQRLEMENEILKKATALLMSDALNVHGSRQAESEVSGRCVVPDF
ncbi:transposase [Candidatus Erwinia dacicola]|nr:transposase [Candidatus Erwinia dacicola]